MSFCWFTSHSGFPNAFEKAGIRLELAKFFLKFSKGALEGKSYRDIKDIFPSLDPSHVETNKAAFQEFGLLYVVPRSNRVSLTPAGLQVYDYYSDAPNLKKNKHKILTILCRSLCRYQFNNPLPVGGNKGKTRAEASDVLPYLAAYYLLFKLDGVLTVSELRGSLFGLQQMSNINRLCAAIKKQRSTGRRFSDLPSLPAKGKTADNLKIYFMSHLSLAHEVISTKSRSAFYGTEQVFEITPLGSKIICAVLDTEWPSWRKNSSVIPKAKKYASIDDYFNRGVGELAVASLVEKRDARVKPKGRTEFEGILDLYDFENLMNLSRKKYAEGKKKYVTHLRTERNRTLMMTAKRIFKMRHGKLFCEVCDFDFSKKYGKRGDDYIEAHHKIPISRIGESAELTIEDLGMVCANCHRMLHRVPWVSIDKLLTTIKKTSRDPK